MSFAADLAFIAINRRMAAMQAAPADRAYFLGKARRRIEYIRALRVADISQGSLPWG